MLLALNFIFSYFGQKAGYEKAHLIQFFFKSNKLPKIKLTTDLLFIFFIFIWYLSDFNLLYLQN